MGAALCAVGDRDKWKWGYELLSDLNGILLFELFFIRREKLFVQIVASVYSLGFLTWTFFQGRFKSFGI